MCVFAQKSDDVCHLERHNTVMQVLRSFGPSRARQGRHISLVVRCLPVTCARASCCPPPTPFPLPFKVDDQTLSVLRPTSNYHNFRPISRSYRERKISLKFSCINFFQIRDVPTQISGHPGHSVSKTTEKGRLHKVFVRDIPTSGPLMSQEYPAQKLYV